MPNKLILLSLTLVLSLFAFANAETQTDVVGFWTIELQPGYNLVAFPVLPQNPAISAVIGDNLGEAEIYSWDPSLNDWRHAIYSSETNRWTGNLFLLERGKAYWIRIPLNQQAQKLVVTGNPEIYTRTNWAELGGGWQFYAPILGKEQLVNEIPPRSTGDLLIAWDNAMRKFDLSEAKSNAWSEYSNISMFIPDQAYILYQNYSPTAPIGPKSLRDYLLEQNSQFPVRRDNPGNGANIQNAPPRPVVVSSNVETPICYEDGTICSGGFNVVVMKEIVNDANVNNEEVQAIEISRHSLAQNAVPDGQFRIALAVGNSPEFLRAGDRAFLVVRGPNNSSTVSNTFEIPEIGRFIPDVTFAEPLTISNDGITPPTAFSLDEAFPNPFNDRFNVDFGIPQNSLVKAVLFDVTGRVVWEQNRQFNAGFHRLTVNPVGASAGVYFLRVNSDANSGIVKVVFVK